MAKKIWTLHSWSTAWMLPNWTTFKMFVRDVMAKDPSGATQDILESMRDSRNLAMLLYFYRECSGCVFTQIEASQTRFVPTFKHQKPHKP